MRPLLRLYEVQSAPALTLGLYWVHRWGKGYGCNSVQALLLSWREDKTQSTAVSLVDSEVIPDWNNKLVGTMPLLGHRNWILIVDSAYPLQTSPGVETIETNAAQLEVARTVLSEIENSIQVRPVVFMDAELPFISDSDDICHPTRLNRGECSTSQRRDYSQFPMRFGIAGVVTFTLTTR
jgi:hypothetical protein